MYDIRTNCSDIMIIRRNIMGNIISFFQEIFMLKEDNSTKIGLSDFRESATPVEKTAKKNKPPKELKLSELMRKGSY